MAVILQLIITLIIFIKKLVLSQKYHLTRYLKDKLDENKSRKLKKAQDQEIYKQESLEKIERKVGKETYKEQVKNKKVKIKEKNKKINHIDRKGKPKGSKGGGRRNPSYYDRYETLEYKKCPDCNQAFQGKRPRDTYFRFLTDLIYEKRGKRLIVTKYEIRGHYCEKCKKIKYPKIDAPPKARMGWGLITWVIIKRVCRKMSFDWIISDLVDLCSEKISKTTFIMWIRKTAKPLCRIYKHLWKVAKKSNYIHIDETGLPINGENWWLWVLVTKNVAIYHVHSSRGHEAIEQELDGFTGIIIADFWSAYNKLDYEQQKCLIHLIRELEKIIYDKLRKKKGLQQKLQDKFQAEKNEEETQSSTTIKRKRGRPRKLIPELSPEETSLLKKDISLLDQTIWNCLLILFFFKNLIHQYNEAKKNQDNPNNSSNIQLLSFEDIKNSLDSLIKTIKKSGVKDGDLNRIIKRLHKFENSLFTFLKYKDVPPHNNPVEQKIRPFVLQRKISGKFGSEGGIDAYAIHLSIFETSKMNKIEYNELLNLVFHEKWEEVLNRLPN